MQAACKDGAPAPAVPPVDEMDGELTPPDSAVPLPSHHEPTCAVDKCDATEDDGSGSLTGQFTWIIENFNKLKQPKLYSPVFQSAQYNWCRLPQGLG